MSQAKLPVVAIDGHWWGILREAVSAAEKADPFATLVALLVALVILTLGPVWIFCHYSLRREGARQKSEFEGIRKNGGSG